jgi:hypothetical protein
MLSRDLAGESALLMDEQEELRHKQSMFFQALLIRLCFLSFSLAARFSLLMDEAGVG